MSSILILVSKRVVEELGLSRLIWDEEYAGSNPASPTNRELTNSGSTENNCRDGRRMVTGEWVRTTRNLRLGLWFCKSSGYLFLVHQVEEAGCRP